MPGDLSQNEHPDRKAKKRLIWGGAIAICPVLLIVANVLWVQSSRRPIDQSAAAFTVTKGESVYRNPKYGVALRLAGTWQPDKGEPHHFCDLRNDAGMLAGFWRLHPSPTQSLNEFSSQLAANMVATGRYAKESESELLVNGVAARKMALRNSNDHNLVIVVVAKKRFTVYILSIVLLEPEMGKVNDRDEQERQRVLEGLGKTIEIF